MEDVLKDIQRIGRDNARMPVSWDDSTNAGFSTGKPWIKVNEDYREWNVAAQTGDDTSVLEFWRKLLALRKNELGLVYRRCCMLDEPSETVYAYTRTTAKKSITIVCSFAREEVKWKCPVETGDLVLCNYPAQLEHDRPSGLRTLRP